MRALHTKILSFIDDGFQTVSLTNDELITALTDFDELYAGEHPGLESPVTDGQYDALYAYTKVLIPTDKYFTGIGSSVRGGKVDLPYEMGSLNQVQIGDIAEWVKKNNLQKSEVVASDKMDGTSALLLYQADGSSQIAYSRGDGVQGADISRHIFKIKGVPKNCLKVLDSGLTVRAEVELTETAFQSLYDAGIRRRGGDAYKNSRNMVAGLMNSKTIPDVCYEHLSVICYEVVGIPVEKKMQLRLLEANGFQVVKYRVLTGNQLTDDYLAKFLNERRDDIDYAIDGLVIEVNDTDERKRMNPTKDTLNPGYAIKYKVADESNQAIATVVKVEWNISKHGYLKPRVCLEPIDLVGVTITHATGFNAAFILNSGIGPGAKVHLTRSGDVIPFITGVDTPAIPEMPGSMDPSQVGWDWDWTYNEAGEKVDAKLKDVSNNNEVAIQQTLDFFSSIEAPHLKEGTIRKLFDLHKYTDSSTAIITMMKYDSGMWVKYIGENGKKIHTGLFDKFKAMPLHVLMGSLPFFGRGVGKRKFKKLEVALGSKALHEIGINYGIVDIAAVDSFQTKTAEKILDGIDDYYEFYKSLPSYVTIIEMKDTSGGVLDGKKICMTGFRDTDLVAQVEKLGGTIQSGVSGATTILVIKDPTSTSGKAKKARDLGVQLMGVDEFKDFIS